MSSAPRRVEAVVERHHEPNETACTHALNLLLTMKKAACPGGPDDAKEIENDRAAELSIPKK
jgi:hypothetical protein